ncbi:MAG: hypothetical protein GX369_01960 [Euryarchaeota archaeon]|nr:hypothetical protein [Euryarchaeota archaeon]
MTNLRDEHMDHLVRLDYEANELERLCNGTKCMIVRGLSDSRPPHKSVHDGDRLFFVQEGCESIVRAVATVCNVDSTRLLDHETSIMRLMQNQRKLMLTGKQFQKWGGHRFMVFVEVKDVERLNLFLVDPLILGSDGWAIIEDISLLKCQSLPTALHESGAQLQI